MPNDDLIIASMELLGQAGNSIAQGNLNRRMRKWSEQQYAKQRADSLSDWHRTNQYNSPGQMMARYKEAGLNPNLIYGTGSNDAGPIRSADTPSWNPQAPRMDLGSVGRDFFAIKMQQAQLANLQSQNDLIKAQTQKTTEETKNVSIYGGKAATETALASFNLHIAEDLRNNTIAQAKANLEKTTQGIKIDFDANQRAAISTASSIREAAERILTLQAQRTKIPAELQEIQARITALGSDVQLKDLDIGLKKMGIQPTDNVFLRILTRIINHATE